MAVLDILEYPNPLLKQISKPVETFDDLLRAFIADLEETMDAGPGATGIAAPQVGRFERIVFIDASMTKHKVKNHGRMVLINPVIVNQEGSEVGREGCLSVPDYTGNVARATEITLQTQDAYGKEHTFQMEGFEARLVQHEMDHLDGVLFLDRLVSRRKSLFKRKTYKKPAAKES
jgi:peptide deformylase